MLVAAWLLAFGTVAAGLAARKRRSVVTWTALGALLGPPGLLVLGLAPPGRCWYCAAPTEGWLTACGWCGEDVRGPTRPEWATAASTARPGRAEALAADATATTESDPEVPPDSLVAGPMGARPTRRGARTASTASLSTLPGPVASLRGRSSADGNISFGPEPSSLARGPAPVRNRTRQAAPLAAEPATRDIERSFAPLTASLSGAPADVTRDDHGRVLVLASGIYVTGSRSLVVGARYGIGLLGGQLQILGPVDVDPMATAIRRPLKGLDATGVTGRLIITADNSGRDRFALVFMSIAGGSAEYIADAISAAVNDSRSVAS